MRKLGGLRPGVGVAIAVGIAAALAGLYSAKAMDPAKGGSVRACERSIIMLNADPVADADRPGHIGPGVDQ